ncbi:MAG: SUMF1/EgtB/PvdO family nonheme iron enzyme [Candidatus Sumerlaeia bacterium]|nr:SUMF1/EgtB/PvdO family nonheme iron enzyme [Candidatus Sumerlaeia bacterium]
MSSTTDSSSVTINTTAPTLDTVTIASDNADSSLAKEGDTITVSITASETISEPTVTIAGNTASVSGSGSSYTATYVVQASDDEGSVSFSIDGYDDAAGNAGSAVSATTDSSSVTIDTTAPTLDTVTIASDNANSSLAKEGDTITVSISASKTISEPTVTIAGNAATVSGSDDSYTATYVVQDSDGDGTASISITGIADAAGNTASTVSSTTDSSSVTIDTTAPVLTIVTISSDNANDALAKEGDMITIFVFANEDISQPTITIAGRSASVWSSPDTATAHIFVQPSDPEGPVSFTIDGYTDAAGNAGPVVTSTTNSSLVTIDMTAPTLDTVTISSSNANSSMAKEGDTITVSITASETITEPTVTIAGNTASVSGSGASYTATHVVEESDDEGNVSFSIDGFADAAGNAGIAVSATTDSSSVTIDTTAPTFTTVTIASDNDDPTLAREGDTITISMTASENITHPTVTVRSKVAMVSGSGASYTATYVVEASDADGDANFAINGGVVDEAGNSADVVLGTTDGSSVTINTSTPTITSIDPADEAVLTSLDEIEVTFSEEVSNLTAGQMTVNGSAADTVTGSNPYIFSGFDAPDLGTVNVIIASGSTDAAGNAFSGDSWSYSLFESPDLEFVSVPAGTFTMGRSNVGPDQAHGLNSELPRHQVTLSAYDIGMYQITNAEFATVMNWALAQGYLANDNDGAPYAGADLVYLMEPDSTDTRRLLFDTRLTGGGNIHASNIEWTGSAFAPRTRDSLSMANHPMQQVSWYGAVAFCNFLAEMEGKPVAYDLSTWEHIDPVETGLQYVASYRLPTESEWERAAAWTLDYTTRFIFPTSSDTMSTARATYGEQNPIGLSANPRTSPVGWYDGINISPFGNIQTVDSPSPVGAYDMAGNVREWCYDRFAVYTNQDKTDPTGPASGELRITRGGSWSSFVGSQRTSARAPADPIQDMGFTIGFRIALVRDHVPLSITAPVDQNELTNEATQTITLTFGEDVTDFDETDITVNNGTLSNFTTVSPDVYTVDVTANSDGMVGIVVEAGAASGSSDRDNGGAGFGFEFEAVPPTIASIVPADEASVALLDEIEVTFTEEVINLTAGQLTVNGSAADTVTGSNPYTFSGFDFPEIGSVTVNLAAGSTTDLAGNAFAGDSWSYESESLIEFVSVPGGTFVMGNSGVGDDLEYGSSYEGPSHDVTLSPYEIGKFQVTNAELAKVINWAMDQGLLAGSSMGHPYTLGYQLYMMEPDQDSTRKYLFSVNTTGSHLDWTGSKFVPRTINGLSMANHPAVGVTWYGAVAYCNFLAEIEGLPVAYDLSTWELIDADPGEAGLQYVASYRLPTEAEWERAAGWSLDYTTRFIYPTSSDTMDNTRATFGGNDPMGLSSNPRSSPVGWYDGINVSPNGNIQTVDSPSPVGAYDMAGNTYEWVYDLESGYTSDAKVDPIGSSGPNRLVRGGFANSLLRNCRVSTRVVLVPNSANFSLGFRIVRVPD